MLFSSRGCSVTYGPLLLWLHSCHAHAHHSCITDDAKYIKSYYFHLIIVLSAILIYVLQHLSTVYTIRNLDVLMYGIFGGHHRHRPPATVALVAVGGAVVVCPK